MKTDEHLKQIAVRIYWFVQHDQINEAVDELKALQTPKAVDGPKNIWAQCSKCGKIFPISEPVFKGEQRQPVCGICLALDDKGLWHHVD